MVRLRKYRYEDAYSVYDWINDPETVKYLGSGYKSPRSVDEIFERLRPFIEEELDGDCFAIADGDSDEYLGEITLFNIDRPAKCAEIAMVLRPSLQGRGIARAALSELIAYAFGAKGLERLYLKCFCANTRAMRLYRGAGFVTEGILRRHAYADGRVQDVAVMGLIKGEN